MMTLFIAASPFIVISMIIGLLLYSFQPATLHRHRESGMNIWGTRLIITMTLALVLTLIIVLPRL